MKEIKGAPVQVGDLESALNYYRLLDETLRSDLRHSHIRIIVLLFGATLVLLAWISIFTNLIGLFGLRSIYVILVVFGFPVAANLAAYVNWAMSNISSQRGFRVSAPDPYEITDLSAVAQMAVANYTVTYKQMSLQTRVEERLALLVMIQMITIAFGSLFLLF